MIKKTAPEKEAALIKLRSHFNYLPKANQRLMLLEALRLFPISTDEIRVLLGINSPAPRVLELRKIGHHIKSRWVYRVDALGSVRRFAEYYLCEVSK